MQAIREYMKLYFETVFVQWFHDTFHVGSEPHPIYHPVKHVVWNRLQNAKSEGIQ